MTDPGHKIYFSLTVTGKFSEQVDDYTGVWSIIDWCCEFTVSVGVQDLAISRVLLDGFDGTIDLSVVSFIFN